ncbi:MAG TPA: hypothetical protein VJ828_14705 [Lacipirellulaceae bacterium]|nr:hypothetical protein [Lacipirellulaceae bacterium]
MNVRYHSLAREEVVEATGYYARIRPTLGAEFLAEFNAAVEMIAANPVSSKKYGREFVGA